MPSQVPLASCGPELSSSRASQKPATAAHSAATATRSQESRLVIRELSHSSRSISVGDLIDRAARRLKRAKVFYGHGTDSAVDDAAAIVFHVLNLSHDLGPAAYRRRAPSGARQSVEDLISRRIKERIPAVYLTHETWFAGLPFYVDSRVLIPRSALAELIERQFTPWIDPRKVERILDVGTGSGCIAIASAKAFPRAKVDAVDISKDALEVAAINVRKHRLGRRVRLVESDHFNGLSGNPTYDIIVSNPPYVGAREMRALPPEYRHEPRIALAAGDSGLDSVRILIREAGRFLRPGGILVVEVGNTETAVRRAFRDLPFVWLDFERGGGGVFLLTAEQLMNHVR
ncbi:MAG: 50S ribosomal protein L3 N(5)-glutamine methyltransferase [Proteobacteria bacterium]|nr:50S ribosomal protein L3 N(5)-glutamine methyltransferase [Pseudomonadota bacterium]